MSTTSSHNFRRVLWTPPTPVGKDRFHCDRCDSTVQFDSRLTDFEVNRLIAHEIKNKFPCIGYDDGDTLGNPVDEVEEAVKNIK